MVELVHKKFGCKLSFVCRSVVFSAVVKFFLRVGEQIKGVFYVFKLVFSVVLYLFEKGDVSQIFEEHSLLFRNDGKDFRYVYA